MNNDADDLILPETDLQQPTGSVAPRSEKRTWPLIAFGVVAFCLLAGALIFVIFHHDPDPPTEDPELSADSSYKYDDLTFNDNITAAENFLRIGDYVSAQSTLEKYSLPERMTAFQKYRYYTTLALLYSETSIADPELAEQYRIYAADNLEIVRKGGI